jgi:hypothetical protein
LQKNLIRIKTYSVNEILPLIKKAKNKRSKVKLKGKLVPVGGVRLKTFAQKGIVCEICGIKGTYFALEKHEGSNGFHLNLYGRDKKGKEVCLSSDHIVPKAHGGDNKSLDNRQTLCQHCNEITKADKLMIKDENGNIKFVDCPDMLEKYINDKIVLLEKLVNEFDLDECNIKKDFNNCNECKLHDLCNMINKYFNMDDEQF